MESAKKSIVTIQGITAINAAIQGNGKYLIGLTVGSGTLVESQAVPSYDENGTRIQWNHTAISAGTSAKGITEIDFHDYNDNSRANIEFTSGSVTQVRGGIVIKQTNYPPKAYFKESTKSLPNLNTQLCNALFLYKLDLVYNNNNQWLLSLRFIQPGTKYKLKTNGFKVWTFGTEVILELQMEVDAAGTDQLIITNQVITTDELSNSLQIIPTLSNYTHGDPYFKKGALLIV